MSEKFNGKYRIKSTRLPNWDYGWNAAYFVTICTQNRFCFFGDVIYGRMAFSPIGHIAETCWNEIPKHFPFVELGAHIIMPNHVHGIIIINNVQTQNIASPQQQNIAPPVQTQDIASPVQTQNIASLRPSQRFGPQSQNLASIIRGFKIGVTKNARLINGDFAWQPRYHDHIIRNDESYHRIRKYINNNPLNWSEDQFILADR